MHVNKLPFLPSPLSQWLVLRNEFIRSCLITNTRGKSVSSHFVVQSSSVGIGIGSHPLAVSQNRLCLATSISNLKYRNLSRYSASTIMRPNSKAFSFSDYDVIGFDLDGTLLRYNLDEMVPLEYELLCRYLVEHKGYSKQLLGFLDNSTKDFLQKGLFLDAERGNILKLGNNGSILRASHGTKPMSDLDIISAYGTEKKWSATMQFINEPMSTWNGPLAEKMRSLLDYFDISVSLVFARAIDEIDASRQLEPNSVEGYTVWSDILEALVNIYSRENFSNGKSGYFEKLKSDPDRFLLKTSPLVIDWLRDLKASKKKLFLLTGSNIDFANLTASYALGEEWKDLFDVVICFARKPGFFYGSREFHNIEGFQETNPIPIDSDLQLNTVYSMGNWNQLKNFFATKMGIDVCKLKSLYVGDNLIQDVYAPDALVNVDSVAISEEMLSEFVPEIKSSNNFKEITASHHWKSYFYEDGMPTLWTHIISKHSKICVPTLEHVANKAPEYRFCADNEFGFYPSTPGIVE